MMVYQETIEAIVDIVCLGFLAYGIFVYHKWYSVAKKADDALNELREESKDGDG